MEQWRCTRVTPVEELDGDNIGRKEKDVEWTNGDAHGMEP